MDGHNVNRIHARFATIKALRALRIFLMITALASGTLGFIIALERKNIHDLAGWNDLRIAVNESSAWPAWKVEALWFGGIAFFCLLICILDLFSNKPHDANEPST